MNQLSIIVLTLYNRFILRRCTRPKKNQHIRTTTIHQIWRTNIYFPKFDHKHWSFCDQPRQAFPVFNLVHPYRLQPIPPSWRRSCYLHATWFWSRHHVWLGFFLRWHKLVWFLGFIGKYLLLWYHIPENRLLYNNKHKQKNLSWFETHFDAATKLSHED